jgi:hypothetical protein
MESGEHACRDRLPEIPEFARVCGIKVALESREVETVALALF